MNLEELFIKLGYTKEEYEKAAVIRDKIKAFEERGDP